MSVFQEGMLLRHEELVALLSLGGKRQFLLFSPDSADYTDHQVWSACCALLSEGLLRQENGKFRMKRELYDVMMPLLSAQLALLFREDRPEPTAIYYLGETVIEMEAALQGHYSLRKLSAQEAVECLMERVQLRCYEPDYPVKGKDEPTGIGVDTPVEELLTPGGFLMTVASVDSGTPRRWVRGRKLGWEPWIEIADQKGVRTDVMTRERLEAAIWQCGKG